MYVDVQNTLLSAAEIFLTRSKVNLLCTGGGEVNGGVVVNKLFIISNSYFNIIDIIYSYFKFEQYF